MPEQDQCKIVLFTVSFPPPAAGGSVEYVANIFANLPPGSAVIHTANADSAQAREFDGDFPQRVVRRDFVLQTLVAHRASRLTRFLGYFQWPLDGFRLILRERPDVVHIGEFNYAFVAALAAAKLLKIPYVLYTYAEEITYISTRPVHFRFFLAALRNAAAVVTVSEYTRNILLDCGADPARIHKVLPAVGEKKRAVPPAAEIEAVAAKYRLGGRRVILTVARLEERKGHQTVIEALPAILKRFPDAVYLIAGTGSYEPVLREKVQAAGLCDSVIFAGCAPDAEISAFYELCDLFVMPHRQLKSTLDTEGCPTVFLEAQAHGKPVVGGNAGGVADAILHGRSGYIVEGTDAGQVAEKVTAILEDPELARRLGAAGREYVDRLTPQNNAGAIRAINSSLLSGGCGVASAAVSG